MQSQQQVVYVGQPQPTQQYNVQRSAMRATGIVQLVAGIGSVLLNIIYFAVLTGLYSYRVGSTGGVGFWGGIPFIVAGALGIGAANGGRCLVIAYLIMSIICAVLAFICIIIWGLALSAIGILFAYNLAGPAIVIILAFLLGLLEFAGAIAGSVMCCKGMGSTTPGTTVAVRAQNVGYVTSPNVQVVTTTTYPARQQPYMGPPQPYMGQPQPYTGQPQPYTGQPQPYMGQPQPYMGQPQSYTGQQGTGPPSYN